MPRKRQAPFQEMLQLRIHKALRRRAEALLGWTAEQADLSPSGAAELTDVYRLALGFGLTELERRQNDQQAAPLELHPLNINEPPISYPQPEPEPEPEQEQEQEQVLEAELELEPEQEQEPEERTPFQRILDGERGRGIQAEARKSLSTPMSDEEQAAAELVYHGVTDGTLKRNIRKTGHLYKSLLQRFS